MEDRSRRGREKSPERARVCMQMQPRVKPMRKVQVVYYLTRNGLLEHPHYMEVTLFATQQLRLRDVMDRLTALRGKGMPMLYSWSCKRSYKNGYVWNDLSENDIIHPAEGAEYVLKGSEIIDQGCSEKFQQFHVSNRPQNPEANFHQKQKPLTPSQHREPERVESARYVEQEYEEEEEEEYEDEEKTSYTSSTTPHSRCSRGVSTDELEDHETHPETQKNHTELTLENSCPLSTSSTISDSDKPTQTSNNTSKRFEDGDPVTTTESAPSRNSVLLQLIACGSSTVAKAKNVPSLKQPVNSTVVKKSTSLHREVVCKSAVKVVDHQDQDFITYMSENPRFGNLQSEEKEYFSGSIVESMSEKRVVAEPVLKKSNSYNEERGSKAVLGEAVEEEKREKAVKVKGKCMPRTKKSSSSKQTKK